MSLTKDIVEELRNKGLFSDDEKLIPTKEEVEAVHKQITDLYEPRVNFSFSETITAKLKIYKPELLEKILLEQYKNKE